MQNKFSMIRRYVLLSIKSSNILNFLIALKCWVLDGNNLTFLWKLLFLSSRIFLQFSFFLSISSINLFWYLSPGFLVEKFKYFLIIIWKIMCSCIFGKLLIILFSLTNCWLFIFMLCIIDWEGFYKTSFDFILIFYVTYLNFILFIK